MAMKKTMKMKKTACKGKPCKAVKKPVAKKVSKIDKPYNKSQVATYLAEMVELKKAQASAILDHLADLIGLHLNKQGPGEFTWPGLVKLRTIRKPAVKARQGVNPFTGKQMMFAAKPARNVVKIRALKKLKETVR
jgi:nucleoid DNA-binding protein